MWIGCKQSDANIYFILFRSHKRKYSLPAQLKFGLSWCIYFCCVLCAKFCFTIALLIIFIFKLYTYIYTFELSRPAVLLLDKSFERKYIREISKFTANKSLISLNGFVKSAREIYFYITPIYKKIYIYENPLMRFYRALIRKSPAQPTSIAHY